METIIKVIKTDEGLEIEKSLFDVDIYAYLTLIKKVQHYINGIDLNVERERYFKIGFEEHLNGNKKIEYYAFNNIIDSDKPLLSDVIKNCLKFFDMTIKQIGMRTRLSVCGSRICKKRQFIMALCKKLTDNPLDEIGKKLGGYDHATVHHATYKAIPSYILADDEELLYWIDYFSKYYNKPNLLNILNNE